jgi:hypothetical protein
MRYKSCRTIEETVQSIVQMREYIEDGTYWDCEQIDKLNQYEKKAWDSLEEELEALLEKVQAVKDRVEQGLGRDKEESEDE